MRNKKSLPEELQEAETIRLKGNNFHARKEIGPLNYLPQ
ncbi:Uncharacterised protein [Escherichia coli]|uniref:Uncharacterized protein n=1 Tax=Escherichia coli TaxID=562 RepID=A0A376ZTF3_ECOLX|nr:Uncharacterised protein [Escherichia coli]